jgi:hypothetical protein
MKKILLQIIYQGFYDNQKNMYISLNESEIG